VAGSGTFPARNYCDDDFTRGPFCLTLSARLSDEHPMAKVKHIVLLQFKAETTPEQIDQVFDEIMDLSEEIPGIEDYVSGVNNSPEGINQGYTHGFIMTFQDGATRDTYLSHPQHEKVKQHLLSLVDSALAFDFEV
jgi:hypothetical protein